MGIKRVLERMVAKCYIPDCLFSLKRQIIVISVVLLELTLALFVWLKIGGKSTVLVASLKLAKLMLIKWSLKEDTVFHTSVTITIASLSQQGNCIKVGYCASGPVFVVS